MQSFHITDYAFLFATKYYILEYFSHSSLISHVKNMKQQTCALVKNPSIEINYFYIRQILNHTSFFSSFELNKNVFCPASHLLWGDYCARRDVDAETMYCAALLYIFIYNIPWQPKEHKTCSNMLMDEF